LTATSAAAGDPVGAHSPSLVGGAKLAASNRPGFLQATPKINDMDVYFLLA
jgi:hypothetical protein